MLPRTAAIGMLLVGCAHAPAERPLATPTATPVGAPKPAAFDGAPAANASPATKPVDFAKDVRPILEARCQPCHFTGGRMYDRLPFDRPETIRQLGQKLFTRIKDEDSQKTIRTFLAQGQ